MLTNIDAFIDKSNQLIDDALNQLIPSKNVPQKGLWEAARYSLFSGGKRLRPLFALAVVESFGGNCNLAVRPICALELIHTYSLIHDDLPCMDDDDMRRGKPSLHRAFTESTAVLAGDFLLTYAFEVISADPYINSDDKIRLITVLAQAAGGDGMIAGQFLDLEEGTEKSIEHLQLIHKQKTGALFLASLEFGGILSHASSIDMEALKKFGADVGLAYQIADDIQDMDDSENAPNFVKMLGLQQSELLLDKALLSAKKNLQLISKNTQLLFALTEKLFEPVP